MDKVNFMSFEDFEEFVKTLPEKAAAVARDFPPGVYRIKEGAPYAISCPGTVVYFYSYTRYGQMGVVVAPENRLPEALRHERTLGLMHGKTEKEMQEISQQPLLVVVDPCWLERIDWKPNISQEANVS
jgi:hypothetical protein